MNPFTTAFDMDAKLGVGDAMVRASWARS